jgi:2-oxoglutarate ferredoxin oxidoreductase subunit alpha
LIPVYKDLPPFKVSHPAGKNGAPESVNGEGEHGFLPYKRDDRLVRPWAIPGTPGLEHRIGGLEKSDVTGNVDYSPANHHHMTLTRNAKVAGIADHIPLQDVDGPASGKLLVISWGGTLGVVRTAVRHMQKQGASVAHAHLRYMNPFPKNFGEIIQNYEKVLIPELNMGQLRLLVRAKYLVDAQGLNKIEGKPFFVHEVAHKISDMLGLPPDANRAAPVAAAAKDDGQSGG